MILIGCRQDFLRNESTQNRVSQQDCLSALNPQDFKKTLISCNQVIEKYQDNPHSYIDRSLIYSLMGEIELACNDIYYARDIIKQQGLTINPLTAYEINTRHEACTKSEKIDAID